MRINGTYATFGILAGAALLSCSETPVAPQHELLAPQPVLIAPEIRISEIHYDNTGTDADERIEVSGPAGATLDGWSIVLYNGNGGTVYDTDALSGTIPATCSARGVVVLSYPSNGIQNGSPDGIALVNASGTVIEFLSYEGTFVAVGGAANGMTSTDIGVAQTGTEPLNSSLQRGADDTWTKTDGSNTFGACNDDGPPPPPPGPPDTRFSEIHYDNVGTDINEAIEVEGPAGTNLTGWSIVLYNGSGGAVYNTTVLNGTIADQCSGRGVIFVSYPTDGIQNGSPDGFALVNAGGTVVEFLSYEGAFSATNGPAAGMTSTNIGVSQPSTNPILSSLRRNADNTWSAHTRNFGACGDDPAPPPPNAVVLSGRTPFDAALPAGFEDQLFAEELDGSTGDEIPTTITWSSETPAIATIDADGVFRALAAGTAILRATATDGTTAAISLPTIVATANPAASYAGNTEFGDPTDGNPSDDFILRRSQYTTSWNNARGIPNWVSYNLEAPHIVQGQDRCDCFTFDPELETAGFARYTTADYTGAGAVAGYGIDRGHLVRSFDRTIGTLDNAVTFYFANIIPQAADNNQGPWSAAETYLGDLARNSNKELYIIAGASGSKGTVKDEGRITIPAHVWKVAVVMPRDQGLDDIDDYQDLEVIALIMPNDPGIRNVNWETYKTTVDAVEALSGYDVLALLADHIEIAVESATNPPVALTDGPYTPIQGETITMSAAGSTDADGDALTYDWDFGDGTTGTGVTATTTYAAAGTFGVRLIVTDTRSLADTAYTTATVTARTDAVENALVMVNQFVADGTLSNGNGNSLAAKLNNALKQIERGNLLDAMEPLQSALDEIAALVKTGRLSEADAAPLRTLIERIIDSLS